MQLRPPAGARRRSGPPQRAALNSDPLFTVKAVVSEGRGPP
eukprot:CAMPEP_0175748034 /NCGR_PEP_ID=MMETSP0097-20121207/59408_1 /TAXON_ID=311494 /ORGANISM="Alexandrium monilatum, Strain CCMP3105" /LENGTH=40 /DNA_ID= /DNA_START= /DNA_END= /DNA_ORIENTATION=